MSSCVYIDQKFYKKISRKIFLKFDFLSSGIWIDVLRKLYCEIKKCNIYLVVVLNTVYYFLRMHMTRSFRMDLFIRIDYNICGINWFQK